MIADRKGRTRRIREASSGRLMDMLTFIPSFRQFRAFLMGDGMPTTVTDLTLEHI